MNFSDSICFSFLLFTKSDFIFWIEAKIHERNVTSNDREKRRLSNLVKFPTYRNSCLSNSRDQQQFS